MSRVELGPGFDSIEGDPQQGNVRYFGINI
jgi:hypothetical protein